MCHGTKFTEVLGKDTLVTVQSHNHEFTNVMKTFKKTENENFGDCDFRLELPLELLPKVYECYMKRG